MSTDLKYSVKVRPYIFNSKQIKEFQVVSAWTGKLACVRVLDLYMGFCDTRKVELHSKSHQIIGTLRRGDVLIGADAHIIQPYYLIYEEDGMLRYLLMHKIPSIDFLNEIRDNPMTLATISLYLEMYE